MKDEKPTLVEDLGELLESVGERLGSELYHIVSPVLKSATSLKLRFVVGFKRGWIKANEASKAQEETVLNPSTT